ncbi:MAG: hypothetical protein E7547_02900 [Ruminococcaceae bacterium]|nr:hypothetical protein [Oscillospiraceae bacterium]
MVISTKLDNTGLKAGLQGLKSALVGIGSAIGVAFGVSALINFGKEAINLASDLQEVQNVVDVAFGSMSTEVDKFAKNAIKQFGLSETVTKRYMGTFGAMSKSFGYSVQEAYQQAAALTGLAGDVASFYNLSVDEAYTKLKAVYTGETEALKELGVVMTQTALDEFAMANGFGKTTKAMTEQEKVALRLAFVQHSLSAAAGDFARTSDSWANQTRVLNLQFESLKAAIGTGLIQVFTPVLKMLNQLLATLINLANKFKEVTAILFGKQVLPSSAAEGVTALADAEEQLAESTDKATEAAKRSLAGFDKLNKLGDDENASASTVSAGGLSGSMGDVTWNTEDAQDSATNLERALDRLKEKFNSFTEWLKSSDFGSGFENLKETASTIGAAFTNAFDEAKPQIQATLDGIKTMFGTAGSTIVTVFGGAFETVTKNISDWAAENQPEIEQALSGTIDILTGAFDTISTVVTDVFEIISEKWEEYGQPIVDWVSKAVLDIHSRLLELYNDIIVPILSEALDWVNRIWDENLKEVVDEVIGFVGRIGEWLGIMYEEKIKPIIDWLMTYVVPIVKTVLSNIQDTFFIVVNFISNTIKNLLKVINGIIDFLVGIFTGDWDRAWQGIKNIFSAVKDWFNAVIETIKEIFKTKFNAVKNTVIGIFDAIKSAVREKINAMLDNVEGMVNGIISGINWLIRKLNSLGDIQMPEILGGGTIGFNLKELSTISIPRLAKGAVIPANREFLAVLGDQKNGRNLEFPENLLRQIVREESGSGKHNRVPFVIQLILNGKVIGEEAVEYVNGVIRKTGKSPIKQGG